MPRIFIKGKRHHRSLRCIHPSKYPDYRAFHPSIYKEIRPPNLGGRIVYLQNRCLSAQHHMVLEFGSRRHTLGNFHNPAILVRDSLGGMIPYPPPCTDHCTSGFPALLLHSCGQKGQNCPLQSLPPGVLPDHPHKEKGNLR